MHHQGYLNNSNIVFKNNQSDMSMELNGRKCCTGNLRHIDTSYFLIKDRDKKEEPSIVYCPKNLMLADYFKKSLQGDLLH